MPLLPFIGISKMVNNDEVGFEFASFAMAVCDLFLQEHTRFIALVGALQKKGLLSEAEIGEAIQSIAAQPPEKALAELEALHRVLFQQMRNRRQESRLHAEGPDGPKQ